MAGTLVVTMRILFCTRYLVIAIPFLYLLLAQLFFVRARPQWLAIGVLLPIIGFNLANRSGAWYPPLDRGPMREIYGFDKNLERSLEYREFHESNVRLVRWLEEHARGELIVTMHPFAHLLGLPRLGYVRQPLGGYCLSIAPDVVPGFRPVVELQPDRELDPLFVRERFEGGLVTFPPCEPGDEVVEDDELSPPLRAFKKRWHDAPPRDPAGLPTWYAGQGWPGQTLADQVAGRMFCLRYTGRAQQAASEAIVAARTEPTSPPLVRLGAELSASVGQLADATKLAERWLVLEPGSAAACLLLAQLRLQSGDFAAASDLLTRAVAAGENSAAIYAQLGLAHERREHWAEAADAYRKALERTANPRDRVRLSDAIKRCRYRAEKP